VAANEVDDNVRFKAISFALSEYVDRRRGVSAHLTKGQGGR